MFGANSTVDREASIQPAAPMPTAVAGWLAASSAATSTIVSRVRATSSAGVSRRVVATIVAVLVDHPAGDLGAPDVDSDGQRHRCRSPLLCCAARCDDAAVRRRRPTVAPAAPFA